MFEMLDVIIAMSFVYLILSMVLKYVMSIVKRLCSIKAKVALKEMSALAGDEASDAFKSYLEKKLKDTNTIKLLMDKNLSDRIKKLNLVKLQEHAFKFAEESGDKVAELYNKISDNIAKTYDLVMEKVSLVFEQRMRYITLAAGLILAFSANVDFFDLYKTLEGNSRVRDELVARAELIGEEFARISNTLDASGMQSIDVISDNIVKLNDKIEVTNLGLGWTRPDDISLTFVLGKIFGLLISGLLISFGAPFWHDLLNSLLSIKGVLRKSESGTGE